MDRCPPELLLRICQAVYNASGPVYPSSLDPFPLASSPAFTADIAPTGLPSSHPPAQWPESISRRTLTSLCLVNRAFYNAAKPWLWLNIQVRLPSSWLALLETIVAPEENSLIAREETSMEAVSNVIQRVALPSVGMSTSTQEEIRQSAIASLDREMDLPDGSVPPDLLSPAASREPSPRRLPIRAQSPGRWRLVRAISNALQAAMDSSLPGAGVYVPTLNDRHPGRHIRHLDFNHFRTIGMRRLVEEGVSNRFVTPDRIYSLLQEMPNLSSFGATEYMDGALSFDVLTELLMRGSTAAGQHAHPPPSLETAETEEEMWSRRSECSPLEAIDFCGCVSAVFVEAATQFVETFLTPSEEAHEARRARGRRNESRLEDELVSFPSVRRLGLRGAKSLAANVLEPFVLAFSNLTDLDLSGTRATPSLLYALGASGTVHLRTLALGRCPGLSGESIEWLLTSGRTTYGLEHLSLYGDFTFRSPLTEQQLKNIVEKAPCFRRGLLQYLDLSSAPLTPEILQSFAPQPCLRSLGFSYIAGLPLRAIAKFILDLAPQVEILTLISTSPELLGPRGSASLALHQQIIGPLAKTPYSFSLTGEAPKLPPATSLRVIELSPSSLAGLGGGSDGWRIIRSKGGRGWYVDCCAGWVRDGTSEADNVRLKRDLKSGHPLRLEYERLADACGNVSSGVGWHARKLEILRGEGLLGREEGLYGAVSFAYSS